MAKQRRLRPWLSTAAGIRRSVYLLAFGLIVLLAGLALSARLLLLPALSYIDDVATHVFGLFFQGVDIPNAKHYAGGALLMLGIYLSYLGVRNLLRDIMRLLNPSAEPATVSTFMRRQVLLSGPNIVAIGGGTGLATILRGLKHKTSRITAVVTVTDDGGSSGRLVVDKQILPPGDIRNCLVALADAEKTMTDLFQHRFEGASGSLSGHSVGNLILAAMFDITGDFDKAVAEISRVLAIRGRVLPSTLERVRLRAEMEDGSMICGETKIAQSRLRVRRIYLDPEDAKPMESVLDAIAEADIIIIGPGSIYTSVLPPLLVQDIASAVAESSAEKLYLCNVMTQPGESDGFTASDHVRAIEANVGRRVFDCVLVNKAMPTQVMLARYAQSGQEFVEPDVDRIRAMGLRVISANLISETDLVRHDPMRVAEAVMRVAR